MRRKIDPKSQLIFLNCLIIFSLLQLLEIVLTDSVLILPAESQRQGGTSQKLLQNPSSLNVTQNGKLERSRNDLSNRTKAVGVNANFQVYSSCSVSQSFSLTFDDGPTELSERLDNTLDSSNLRGTFFINGNNFGCIYDRSDVLTQRFNKGHLIASHTWSHVHLNQGTYEQISKQVELLEQAMIKILGVKPLYFRPPYGEYNDIVLQVLQEKGYKGLIMWSEDSGDTFVPPPSSSQIIENYENYPEKTIVLNHETHAFMVDEVVPAVIPKLQAKNFKLLPVVECLNLGSNPQDWYQFVQDPGSRDDSWTCDGTPAPGQFD